MTKMRSKDPNESWATAYVLRPVVWFVFQFSSEARFIRKHRRRQPTANTGPWPSLPPTHERRRTDMDDECRTDHVNGPVRYVVCTQCGEVAPLCRDCDDDIYGHWPCDEEQDTTLPPLVRPAPSPTDLPDAETAWKAWQPKPERHWTVAKTAFLAGFAAASGPWAEQLDAANAEQTPMGQPTVLPNYEWRWRKSEEHKRELREKLKAALARNAELEAENARLKSRETEGLVCPTCKTDFGDETDPPRAFSGQTAHELMVSAARYRRESIAARAELDNLRGKCICNTGPGTDGPDETCPVHGRSYAEWVERGDQKQAELDNLRGRLTALADRWEARAPDMDDDARDILLNHARRIRDEIGPDIPLPDQHVCDDYCHSCREPGEA